MYGMDAVTGFLRFCLEHGLGGLALLVIVGALALLIVLSVASGAMWLIAEAVTGLQGARPRPPD